MSKVTNSQDINKQDVKAILICNGFLSLPLLAALTIPHYPEATFPLFVALSSVSGFVILYTLVKGHWVWERNNK